ncbi:YgfZ/GcvT domain-containing protein [Marilutibacter chinensis]|uniref:Folate-binding protein n=1 Tax=Marilutibacter chinensis TaxID=2912247 RepID=A0ABS9HR72_9GAMM|nr:folate-binding protein [Lysobacter chinensis]MCF7220597.1 folate-binding protein [Lysobacter chinensis]
MPDNPQSHLPDPAGPLFALPDCHVVALRGRDALAFAQAQFMNDVDALADGQWQWSGWLTPKGRVVALFALLRVDPQTAWLLLADADPEAFAEALRRFVFRSKIEIETLEGKAVYADFSAPSAAHGAHVGRLDGDELEFDMGTPVAPRRMCVGGRPAEESPAQVARWRQHDMQHGLPRLEAGQSGHWTPQQLSLERLRAFSVKKGCYPGQEIVARTHFLGKAKRGLMRIEAAQPLASGQELQSEGGTVGTLVSVGHDGAQWSALVVAPLDHPHDALRVEDVEVREAPLLDGLAR